MNQKEKEILPGTVKMYGGSTQKKTPFTTQEEGDKFNFHARLQYPLPIVGEDPGEGV